ncbi:helix-turn-helix domain-containing protein [Acinetobacter bereziniae]|uniref:helix-turn-helix domain-containing protein n=1 Tax=Acinetobacter bereziniae TaxID=106648 RepID=UPI001250B520|nr:helix-turn-helix domain-containing protein [Acinetobacter bereziniae]MBJ9905315.1 helix-turn-helix domain-containing protein [Acinetobacter bereziniae]MCU4320862.1 helix-turn-helix domain-containing protein [Acinetobacter bereziniae]MCU4601555.1 helix-turn-helix domain-containing protein [Acinetobacter bereziniae]
MIVLQQWLIEQRQAKNLTKEQLALQLNKSVFYIQDIESGAYELFKLDQATDCLKAKK